MSDKKQEVRIVTPTGRVAFIKNLFVKGGEKERYSGALVFSKDQDITSIKNLMMNAAKEAGFTKEDVNHKDFSWGVKTVDTNELDFCNEGDRIANFDRNGAFGAPEVKSSVKGPDGKYEDLQEGDLKAGDHCRVLLSAFGWTYKKRKGVKLNFEAVQFIKSGEAYYSAPTSDSAWDSTEFDTAPETTTPEVFDTTDSNEDDWSDAAF